MPRTPVYLVAPRPGQRRWTLSEPTTPVLRRGSVELPAGTAVIELRPGVRALRVPGQRNPISLDKARRQGLVILKAA
jgi:hypothetical protein